MNRNRSSGNTTKSYVILEPLIKKHIEPMMQHIRDNQISVIRLRDWTSTNDDIRSITTIMEKLKNSNWIISLELRNLPIQVTEIIMQRLPVTVKMLVLTDLQQPEESCAYIRTYLNNQLPPLLQAIPMPPPQVIPMSPPQAIPLVFFINDKSPVVPENILWGVISLNMMICGKMPNNPNLSEVEKCFYKAFFENQSALLQNSLLPPFPQIKMIQPALYKYTAKQLFYQAKTALHFFQAQAQSARPLSHRHTDSTVQHSNIEEKLPSQQLTGNKRRRTQEPVTPERTSRKRQKTSQKPPDNVQPKPSSLSLIDFLIKKGINKEDIEKANKQVEQDIEKANENAEQDIEKANENAEGIGSLSSLLELGTGTADFSSRAPSLK